MCNCGYNISIGENFYSNHNLTILDYAKIIEIGNNVWLGGNVVVPDGVKISGNAIIGTGSVVKRDISSNCVVVWNTCKVIKNIK